jgi:hypothetical protein
MNESGLEKSKEKEKRGINEKMLKSMSEILRAMKLEPNKKPVGAKEVAL